MTFCTVLYLYCIAVVSGETRADRLINTSLSLATFLRKREFLSGSVELICGSLELGKLDTERAAGSGFAFGVWVDLIGRKRLTRQEFIEG